MRVDHRFLSVSPVLAGVILTLLVVPGVGAQDLARIYHVVPREDAAFEAALMKHARDRAEHGDPWNWGVYEVVMGEGLGTFYIRSGGHTWSEFDAYDRGFGAEAGPHFQADVAPTIEDISGYVTRGDTAHMRLPDSLEDIRLYEIITYHLKPGKEQQFNRVIGRIHDAIVASDWPVRYAFADPVLGGSGPRKDLVIFNRDWADFEEPETPFDQMLVGQVGEEEAEELFRQLGDSFRYIETKVLAFRPDLSVEAAEQAEGGTE